MPKIEVLAGSVSGEVCLLVLQVVAFSLGPHMAFTLFMYIPAVSSSKDVSPIGLGPLLMTSFNFNYLCKGSISRYIHILRY